MVCFEKEKSGSFLINNKAIKANSGIEIRLKYLKISGIFINIIIAIPPRMWLLGLRSARYFPDR